MPDDVENDRRLENVLLHLESAGGALEKVDAGAINEFWRAELEQVLMRLTQKILP